MKINRSNKRIIDKSKLIISAEDNTAYDSLEKSESDPNYQWI